MVIFNILHNGLAISSAEQKHQNFSIQPKLKRAIFDL
jgi:hypothetical protein